jgi:hypothetical protein
VSRSEPQRCLLAVMETINVVSDKIASKVASKSIVWTLRHHYIDSARSRNAVLRESFANCFSLGGESS